MNNLGATKSGGLGSFGGFGSSGTSTAAKSGTSGGLGSFGGFGSSGTSTTAKSGTSGGLGSFGGFGSSGTSTTTTSGLSGGLGGFGTSAPAQPSGPVDPPVDTQGLQAKDAPYAQLPSMNGQPKEYKLLSVAAMPKFKDYGPDELRVFDYIKKGLIDKMVEQPRSHAGGFSGAQGASTGLNQGTGTVMFTGTQNVSASNPSNVKYAWAQAEGKPEIPPSKVKTAENFFKSATMRFRKEVEEDDMTGFSMIRKMEDAGQFTSLFEPTRVKVRFEKERKPLEPIHVNPELLHRGGYAELMRGEREEDMWLKFKTIPPLSQIKGRSSSIPTFRIVKENVAEIDFQKPVDVGSVNFEEDIALSRGFVDVYRTKRMIPKEGTGLNTDAVISMWGIWPKDQETGKRVEIRDAKDVADYEARLKEFCAAKHATFVFYLPERGFFQFLVRNFEFGPYSVP